MFHQLWASSLSYAPSRAMRQVATPDKLLSSPSVVKFRYHYIANAIRPSSFTLLILHDAVFQCLGICLLNRVVSRLMSPPRNSSIVTRLPMQRRMGGMEAWIEDRMKFQNFSRSFLVSAASPGKKRPS